jgi:predicted GIY-YIG superfamily endonuclease
MYSIYKIEKDGKVLYIGKTINFQRRKWQHTYKRKLDKTYNFIVIRLYWVNKL